MAEFDSSPLSIDLDRIASVCEEEWELFLGDMNIEPVPERQDLRGFLLNWVAVFAPEAFPPTLSAKMADWMDDDSAFGRSDPTWQLVKRPFIGATVYVVTGNPHWLRIQFDNFAHGDSQLRSFFHRTLALIAPRLTFDAELIARLEAGLRSRYFVMSPPLVLYAVSQGDVEEKIANLTAWKTTYPMNPDEEKTVARFLSDEPAPNPLQSWLLKNTSYVALRLGCQSGIASQSVRLPIGLGFSEVWERLRKHPLSSGYVSLERHRSTKTMFELSVSNPNDEVLYLMKDASGNYYGIPFSSVEMVDDFRNSFENEKEAQLYEKDAADAKKLGCAKNQ